MSKSAQLHLTVTSQEIKDILQQTSGTPEERMHLRACAGLYYQIQGQQKYKTNKKNWFLWEQLQEIKHIGDTNFVPKKIFLSRKLQSTQQESPTCRTNFPKYPRSTPGDIYSTDSEQPVILLKILTT
jgi:hypothetical protein